MASSYSDPHMQSVLDQLRRYSHTSQNSENNNITNSNSYHQESSYSSSSVVEKSRSKSPMVASAISRRQSNDILMNDLQARRLSEAGVNRRPSAALVLTEDTSSFIVGDRVYVDGIKPGRIQYIGETKFGPGEWAGVFLDEPMGKNDGMVGSTRYFMCEPKHGVFSKLHRLTREPIDGAEQALDQIRKYGYDVIEAPDGRRGSVGSDYDRGGSKSPYRASTPEARRDSLNRYSPDSSYSSGGTTGSLGRRGSRLVPPDVRRSSMGNSPIHMRRTPPGKSPLASPRNSRSNLGYDRDPEIIKLANETRRLSMEASNGQKRPTPDRNSSSYRPRQSTTPDSTGRRSSESSSQNGYVTANGGAMNGQSTRRGSEAINADRRTSKTPPVFSRKTSESLGLSNGGSGPNSRRGSKQDLGRKPSSELNEDELSARRMSEAGLRRPSANSDEVLNEDTAMLMVGMPVWVDGTKHGRIAYIGEVHFAKGDMAGVHLDTACGKNNGTVGGVMYFQCESKRGIFSRLHRLTLRPLSDGY